MLFKCKPYVIYCYEEGSSQKVVAGTERSGDDKVKTEADQGAKWSFKYPHKIERNRTILPVYIYYRILKNKILKCVIMNKISSISEILFSKI